MFNLLTGLLVLAFLLAWSVTIHDVINERREVDATPVPRPGGQSAAAPSAPITPGRSVSSAMFDNRTTSTAYLNDAALEFLSPLRGHSGKLRAAFRVAGTPLSKEAQENITAVFEAQGGDSVVAPDLSAPGRPGVYKIAVQIDNARRGVQDLSLVSLVPFANKKNDRIGLYYLGSWPYERGGKPRSPAYGNPMGFIEVTRENQDTYVSEHFRLRDFLTKDQREVWPKYLLLDPRLLDKLELMIADLNARGYNVKHLTVMSGFRTPRYNHGGGNTAGRANLSRHMYGDGADVFVDNDRDNWTDDVDGNGRVDLRDTEIVSESAERVERKYPSLLGGVGTYVACCGHGPFTHVDIRGYRARWRGTGNG